MEPLAVIVSDAQQGIADDEPAESLSSQFADAHGFQLAQCCEGLSPLLGVISEADLEDRASLDGKAGRARLALGRRPRIDPTVSQSRSIPMVAFAAADVLLGQCAVVAFGGRCAVVALGGRCAVIALGRRHAVAGVLLGRRSALFARLFCGEESDARIRAVEGVGAVERVDNVA